MGSLRASVEPYGVAYCVFCGQSTEHTFDTLSVAYSASGRPLSVLVWCGFSGCGAMREESVAN